MSGDEAAFLFEYSFKFFVGIYFCYMLISVVEGFVVDILLNGFKEVFYIVFYTVYGLSFYGRFLQFYFQGLELPLRCVWVLL